MERATLIFILLILCTSIVSATTFTIGEQQETISVSPNQEVGRTMIIIDNNQTSSFDSLKANELQLLPVTPGEHQVEIRYIKTFSYAWERPTITKNDAPATLKYVEYDKDKKKVEFSITGADFFHPDDLSYGSSVQKALETYDVQLNDYTTLTNCYPRITTGQNLFFSCKSGEYANKLSVTFPLGIVEKTTITIMEETLEETIQGTNKEQQKVITDENMILEEQIELHDTIKTNVGHMPVTVFIILMFLAFMTILFVASHHNYESKKAGTHHKVKRK